MADVAAGRAVIRLAGGVQCALQPRRGARGIPATGCAACFKRDFGLIRRVVFQKALEFLHRGNGVNQGRGAQAEFEGRIGPQYIACIFERGKAFGSRDGERGRPCAVEQGLNGIGRRRQCEGSRAAAVGMRPREALVDFIAQYFCCGLRLSQAIGRHFAMKTCRQQSAGRAVF